jgi:glycosyltransferase involved in cell wall biosynthesis
MTSAKLYLLEEKNHDKGTDRLTNLINSIHKLDLSNNVIINVAKAGSQSKTELEFLSEKYDFVNLYHNLNKSDLNTLYKDSDILFLPSRFENFGNSAVEALF